MYKFNSGQGAIVCDVCSIIFCTGLSPSKYRMIREMLGQGKYWHWHNEIPLLLTNELSKPYPTQFDLCETCDADNSSQAPIASLGEENE
jgi:hypothetical protein